MTQTKEPKTAVKAKARPELKPEKQFVQSFVQALIQWAPFGGTSWAFVSFLLQQDWMVALLIFPAEMVTAVWAAYSKSFISTLQDIYGERGKNDATALVKGLDSLNALLGRKSARFENHYLRCQALSCQGYRTDGMVQQEGIFSPLLTEVFVPLELDASSTLSGFNRREQMAIARRDGFQIWDLLAKAEQEAVFRQIAILAWGGYGKTTLLKHIAYIYGSKKQENYGRVPKLIPFFLVLRKHRDILAKDDAPDLPEFLTQYHLPSLPDSDGLKPPTDWAKNLLKDGRAIVMLDGFDELSKTQRPKVARWLNRQMRRYGKSIFILTARPLAYNQQPPGDALSMNTVLWVKELKEKQRRRFVERWYFCQERYAHGGRETPDVKQVAQEAAEDLLKQIAQREELQDLSKNPLMLNMIVQFHRRYPNQELPKRRADLYRRICEMQLRDRPGARKLETLLLNCEVEGILQRLALEMMQRHEERLDRETLLERFGVYLDEVGESVDPKEILKDVVQISELLVQRESEEYEFAHLSFQEYLAAAEIKETKQEALLYDHLEEDWWKQTILLYGAQVNPTKLIRTALAKESQKAKDLAYRCWQETSKRIEPELQAELQALGATVQTSRYAELERLLRAQQWLEADRETYRLMITTVGKEEGQGFSVDDLKTFPCEDLRTIDGLWVQHSQGKYGFSVQKRIWEEISPRDFNGWSKFGDRVGWRANDSWLSDSNLLLGRSGVLPRFGRVQGFATKGHTAREMENADVLPSWTSYGFFYRAKTCRL